MGDDLTFLHPQFRLRAEKLQEMTGCGFRSTYRSSIEQEYLWRNQGTQGIGAANPPGTSNHEAVPYGPACGLAIDFTLPGGYTWPEFHAVAATVGIHFPIPEDEEWHGQPIEVAETYFTGIPELADIVADESADEELFALLA